MQAISPKSPTYEIVSQAGPEHQKVFVAKVFWEGRQLGLGEGPSKKQAETAAALDALESRRWEQPGGPGTGSKGGIYPALPADRPQSQDGPEDFLGGFKG